MVNMPAIFDTRLLAIHNKFISDLHASRILSAPLTKESFFELITIIDEMILNIVEHFAMKVYDYRIDIMTLLNVHNTLCMLPVMVMIDTKLLDMFYQMVNDLKKTDSIDALNVIRDKFETITTTGIVSSEFRIKILQCVNSLIFVLQYNKDTIAKLTNEIEELETTHGEANELAKDTIDKLTTEINRLRSLHFVFTSNDYTIVTLS